MILRHKPAVVTLVVTGRSNGTVRADEDELCALYLRAHLEGRQPDVAAVRALVATMPPPPDVELIKTGWATASSQAGPRALLRGQRSLR